jgi:hypothetical protein
MKSMPKTMETTLAIMLNLPIWIDRRFFQSFLSGFTIAISARTQIFPLALINPCIILIVIVNKFLVSLSFSKPMKPLQPK